MLPQDDISPLNGCGYCHVTVL